MKNLKKQYKRYFREDVKPVKEIKYSFSTTDKREQISPMGYNLLRKDIVLLKDAVKYLEESVKKQRKDTHHDLIYYYGNTKATKTQKNDKIKKHNKEVNEEPIVENTAAIKKQSIQLLKDMVKFKGKLNQFQMGYKKVVSIIKENQITERVRLLKVEVRKGQSVEKLKNIQTKS